MVACPKLSRSNFSMELESPFCVRLTIGISLSSTSLKFSDLLESPESVDRVLATDFELFSFRSLGVFSS